MEHCWAYIFFTLFPFPVAIELDLSMTLSCRLVHRKIVKLVKSVTRTLSSFPWVSFEQFLIDSHLQRPLSLGITDFTCLITPLPTQTKCCYKPLGTHFSPLRFDCLEGRAWALTSNSFPLCLTQPCMQKGCSGQSSRGCYDGMLGRRSEHHMSSGTR